MFRIWKQTEEKITGEVDLNLPENWQKYHADKVALLRPDLRNECVQFLKVHLKRESIDKIRQAIDNDPQEWWTEYHFGYGMYIRNFLRDNGFGEKDFNIDNLDDYCVGLVEEAVKLPSLYL